MSCRRLIVLVIAAGHTVLLGRLANGNRQENQRKPRTNFGYPDIPLGMMLNRESSQGWTLSFEEDEYEHRHVHQLQCLLGVRFGQNPNDQQIMSEILYDIRGTNSGGAFRRAPASSTVLHSWPRAPRGFWLFWTANDRTLAHRMSKLS
eukprot:s3460_g3.t1